MQALIRSKRRVLSGWILATVLLCSYLHYQNHQKKTRQAYYRSLSQKATKLSAMRHDPRLVVGAPIPPAYWGEAIAELHPIRVYMERKNLFVVQLESETGESGIFIRSDLSSWRPQGQSEGMEFIPLGEGVYRYRRDES